MVKPGDATDEEKERAERLKRIKRCEEELQILRNLPADKVSAWIASRRDIKGASPSRKTTTRQSKSFVPNSTGPIASERVRIRERAADVEALIAQGRFRQQTDFPSTIKVDPKPLKQREPGAIRLTDLQQRMVAKSQKRQEEEDNVEEKSRQELLQATESLSPRHRAKMRRSMGQKKSKAQQRYTRLLSARHRASELLQHRHARQSYGIDERALAERQLLIKQTRALREKLLNPESLQAMRTRFTESEALDIDQILPIPAGPALEKTRVAHLQSLAVLRADKEWWRAVRKGEERDIRTCMDKEPCWTGWKNPERLLSGKSLYGRSAPPPDSSNNGSTSPRKDWFVEPALGAPSRDLSDWWLNYALGALAESSEAERAIEEASSAAMTGKSFSDVLERQTSKIVDYYKQQMIMERDEHLRCTRLEEAEREWEEQDALEHDTYMEQSLAATMVALEAPFALPETPRRNYEDDDSEYYGNGNGNGNDEDIDVSRTTPSPAPVKTPKYRSGLRGRNLSERLSSTTPPRSSAMRRSGRMNDAGKKTTRFDDDGDIERKTQRMNRTYSGGSRSHSRAADPYDGNMFAKDSDEKEGRKTTVMGASASSRSNHQGRRRQSGGPVPQGGRRTSFMAMETIRGTYDAILESSPTRDREDKAREEEDDDDNEEDEGGEGSMRRKTTTKGGRDRRLNKTLPTPLKGEGTNTDTRDQIPEEGVVPPTGTTTTTRRGHRRRATTEATSTPSRQSNGDNGVDQVGPGGGGGLTNGATNNAMNGNGNDVNGSSGGSNMLSPASEMKKARGMLKKLFSAVIKSCRQEQKDVTTYITDHFKACAFSGEEERGILTYEQFMKFLIDLDKYVEQITSESVGMMDMNPKVIDVSFSIFDVEGNLKITMDSVMRFVHGAVGHLVDSKNSNGIDTTMGTQDDDLNQQSEEQEDSAENIMLQSAVRQVKKGANWVARNEKKPLLRVIRDTFAEKDSDGSGKVTTGQFAQVIHALGIEMTRSMTEVLLRDLGVQAENKPNERCVNYKKLLQLVQDI
jgi:Ca2+-binding EF-hand superfamily protein